MELIEQINLDNGLIINIYDLSRPIADDTAKVEICVKTEINLKESYFNSVDDYALVKKIFSEIICFEYRKERSFIAMEKQDEVRDELIATFKSNSLNYISSKNFPQSFALTKLKDIKQNPTNTVA